MCYLKSGKAGQISAPTCTLNTVHASIWKVGPDSPDGDISNTQVSPSHTHAIKVIKVLSYKSNEARFVSKFALLHTSADCLKEWKIRVEVGVGKVM